MSGSILGIGGLVAGALYGIASVAAGTSEIAVKGGIASYEQFQIANTCTHAITCKKKEMACLQNQYKQHADNVCLHLTEREDQEITRLYNKLLRKGYGRDQLQVQGSAQERLLQLMTLDIASSNTPSTPVTTAVKNTNTLTGTVRTPQEIYRSVAVVASPLLATIFPGSVEHREISALLSEAEKISLSASIDASEKSLKLRSVEAKLLTETERFKKAANRHERLQGQYIGVATALRKLAEYCSESVNIPAFEPFKADAQIRDMQRRCAALRQKAASIAKEDTQVLRVGQIMADIVAKSIEESGNRVLKIEKKPYGTESYHSFGSSVLKATTTNEGVISLEMVASGDENTVQLNFDERRFCQKGLPKIVENLNKNGVAFAITDQAYLDPENVHRLHIVPEDEEWESETGMPYAHIRQNDVLYADAQEK